MSVSIYKYHFAPIEPAVLEGPEFPNELFRQYNSLLARVNPSLTLFDDEHIRNQVWLLRQYPFETVGLRAERANELLFFDQGGFVLV